MNKEIDLYRLRLVIRGALDFINRDAGDINEALTAQGKVKLTVTIFWSSIIVLNSSL